MPSLPRDPIDRLASAEQRLSRAEGELAANRRRSAETTAPRELFPARTVERTTTSTTTTSGGGDPTSSTSSTTTTTGYPRCCDAVELPIVTQQLAVDAGDLTTKDRWVQQLTKGLSRIGWLPPNLRVWVAHDRQRYVILDAAEHLHGVACCAIPRATLTGEHTWELGTGTVAVFRENESGQYVPQRYADGSAVTMIWHNADPDADVPAGPLLTAHLNADTRWVVDADREADAESSSTTTTTAGVSACSGRCKWVWSAAGGEWTLDADGCGPTSTSTSSSTSTTTGGESTSSSTSTTTPLCVCGELVPASTSTTSSTSTTTGGCQCLYPTFCGDADGECTYTDCSPSRNYPPACSTSSSTSTTTCDCNTTTTPSGVDCSSGCDWVGVPTASGWVWRQVSNGCSSICPCPSPDGDPYCSSAHTDCVYTPPPPPPPPPPGCSGGCTWWWVPSLLTWIRTADNCADVANCNCTPPSYPGNVCAPTSTPCTAPTTTSAPTATTAGPCADCYQASTSTTTTTASGCDGQCKWQGSAVGSWSLISSPCASGCPCIEPAHTPTEDCEVAWTPCAGTTTSSSTTTTTAACGGVSQWVCAQPDGYAWSFVSSDCDGGCAEGDCGATPPTAECNESRYGAIYAGACECGTTSTTSTSSTSTTSTSSTSTTSTSSTSTTSTSSTSTTSTSSTSTTSTTSTTTDAGACCYNAGTEFVCQIMTAAQCAEQLDGYYLGNGTSCDPFPCTTSTTSTSSTSSTSTTSCAACTAATANNAVWRCQDTGSGWDWVLQSEACGEGADPVKPTAYCGENQGNCECLSEPCSGCWLSTAASRAAGLPDDCDQLDTLRAFRDVYLSRTVDGKALIQEYYSLAPAILNAINQSPDRDAVLREIFGSLVTPAVALIKTGRFEEATKLYRSMVYSLQNRYEVTLSRPSTTTAGSRRQAGR